MGYLVQVLSECIGQSNKGTSGLVLLPSDPEICASINVHISITSD